MAIVRHKNPSKNEKVLKDNPHFGLCVLVAEKFVKNNDIVLYEYQTTLSNEHPDVLCYHGRTTTLFEIKVSKSDFKADKKKPHRHPYKTKYNQYSYNWAVKQFENGWINEEQFQKAKKDSIEKIYDEWPYLGGKRYYVCPEGLIQPEEITNGFGLYWVKGKRFYLKKESNKFIRNIHQELTLLNHALRAVINNGYTKHKILAKPY